MKHITKLMLAIHRILGTILSILFLVWFLSGMVMIFHTFPRADREDKRAKMDLLTAADLPSLTEIQERVPGHERIKRVSLNSYLGQTVFQIQTDSNSYKITADSTETLPVIDWQRIERVAALWNKAPVERVDSMYHLDQWIPFGRLKEDFPIYKFHFNDPEKHELYISSKTGDVLQYTDKSSRFWAWIGAIPHWVYFTSLRQDVDLWADVVVWLSGIGCIMCIAGFYLGFRDFHLARKRKKWSPYKKFWYKWHHIISMAFGLFVLTFCFSGMMSLSRVQEWGINAKLPFNPSEEIRQLTPSPLDYALDYREVLKAYPDQVRQLEWSSFGPIPFYVLLTDNATLYVEASHEGKVRLLNLKQDDLLPILQKIHGADAASLKIELMQEYDEYYLSKNGHLGLPVWKVTIDDVDNSCYYIDPVTGKYRYVNTPSRWNHWTYSALHSLNIKFLVDRPVLWNIVMWTLLLGGTFVSLSGVWLAIKYIQRKLRR